MLVTQVSNDSGEEEYAVRPDWEYFFETTRRQFEIVIWTVLPKRRAMRLIPLIDPHRRIKAIMCSEDCRSSMLTEGHSVLVKVPDVTVFQKESSIFLDVNPFSVARVQENSYLLNPFTGKADDSSGSELIDILPVLRTLQYLKDVRPVNMHMEQHFKKKQEIKELSIMKVPENEGKQRQSVRVQRFNPNFLKHLSRLKLVNHNASSSLIKSNKQLEAAKPIV